MSAYSDLILFVVNLAVNLFLFGLFIAGSVAVSFGLIKNAAPRLRYTVAVAAFLLAAFFPLAVTFNGSTGLETIFEARQNGGANAFDDNFDNQNSFVTSASNLPAPKLEAEKPSFDLLNDFTSSVAGSFIGGLFFALWFLGAAAFLSRDIVAYRRLKKARQTWREAINAERAELALPDEIPLYFAEESPATVGFFRPVIVLPEHFPDDLPLAAKYFVVQHELAHALWRDPLINFFLRLIRSVFWISPALWMLERIVAAERESAADHAAISLSSASESEFEATALNYAATLVSVARHFNVHTRRGTSKAGTIGLNGGSFLENRIRRLLTYTSEPVRLRIFLASIIFVFSLSGMLFMPVAFQAKQTDVEDKAFITENQNSEDLASSVNPKISPMSNRENKIPQVIEFDKNKDGKIKTVTSKPNENQPKEFSNDTRENTEIPQLIYQSPKPNGTFNENAEDAGREELIKKLSREDEKNSRLRQKTDDLGKELRSLDDSRKNLSDDVIKMRQKAAADADAEMMQTRKTVNTNQNTNININININ